MAYTFLNQQSKLSSLLGDSNSAVDDMFPLAVRKKEINRGEVHFAVDALNLKEYATGTVASMEISVPSDWIKNHVLTVNDVVISNDYEIALEDWERYYNFGGEKPYFYIWEFSGTRKLKFLGSTSSVNGQTYQLFYFKFPTTELSGDTDTSLHPEEYREGPVYYAASELMKQIGKHDQAALFRQEYETLVSKAYLQSNKQQIVKEYARPDFGTVESDTTDVQGRGYY